MDEKIITIEDGAKSFETLDGRQANIDQEIIELITQEAAVDREHLRLFQKLRHLEAQRGPGPHAFLFHRQLLLRSEFIGSARLFWLTPVGSPGTTAGREWRRWARAP